MEEVRQWAALFLIWGGVFFFGVGTLGLMRLPDALTRMHAATKADTLGAGMVLVGVALAGGLTMPSIKLLLCVALIWLTNPTATHVIASAAVKDGSFPQRIDSHIELEDGERGDGS